MYSPVGMRRKYWAGLAFSQMFWLLPEKDFSYKIVFSLILRSMIGYFQQILMFKLFLWFAKAKRKGTVYLKICFSNDLLEVQMEMHQTGKEMTCTPKLEAFVQLQKNQCQSCKFKGNIARMTSKKIKCSAINYKMKRIRSISFSITLGTIIWVNVHQLVHYCSWE